MVTKAATKVQRKIETTKEKRKKSDYVQSRHEDRQRDPDPRDADREGASRAKRGHLQGVQDLAPKVVEQGYKPYRAITMIAEKYRKTPAGIISILQNAGLYTNSKEYVESIQNTEAENAQQEDE